MKISIYPYHDVDHSKTTAVQQTNWVRLPKDGMTEFFGVVFASGILRLDA